MLGVIACTTACDGNVTVYLGKRPLDDAPPIVVLPEAGAPVDVVDAGSSPLAPNAPAFGCGASAAPGVQTLSVDVDGNQRQAYVSVPASYDPNESYPLLFGFHTRDETGLGARTYLDLESVDADWALFVYPDAVVRIFPEDDVAAGWQNGPTGDNYGGTDDLDFIHALIDEIDARFCVDRSALFATGVGWGGEFSSVLACYADDRFLGIAPVGANPPYYLPRAEEPSCLGSAAAWVFQGKGDVEFPIEFGEAHVEFWKSQNDCSSETTVLAPAGASEEDECSAYACRGRPVRQCWYTASAGHGVPDAYYAGAVVGFFKSLLP